MKTIDDVRPFINIQPARCVVLLLLTMVLATGCGPKRPDMIPVSGKITFGGAAPPGEGAIYFAPLEVAGGGARRPGRAMFDESGNYQVTSFEDADGLVPGTYRVRVECWKSVPTMDKPGESYVPADFAPGELNISADSSSVTHNIDVPAANGAQK